MGKEDETDTLPEEPPKPLSSVGRSMLFTLGFKPDGKDGEVVALPRHPRTLVLDDLHGSRPVGHPIPAYDDAGEVTIEYKQVWYLNVPGQPQSLVTIVAARVIGRNGKLSVRYRPYAQERPVSTMTVERFRERYKVWEG